MTQSKKTQTTARKDMQNDRELHGFLREPTGLKMTLI